MTCRSKVIHYNKKVIRLLWWITLWQVTPNTAHVSRDYKLGAGSVGVYTAGNRTVLSSLPVITAGLGPDMASETSRGRTDIRRYSAGVFRGVKCFSLLPVFFLASYMHPGRFTCSVILLFKNQPAPHQEYTYLWEQHTRSSLSTCDTGFLVAGEKRDREESEPALSLYYYNWQRAGREKK